MNLNQDISMEVGRQLINAGEAIIKSAQSGCPDSQVEYFELFAEHMGKAKELELLMFREGTL